MRFRTNHAALVRVAVWVLFFSLPIVHADDKVDQVTIVPVPGRGQPVVARADAVGTIHLLYDAADGPQYVKSLDNGQTFSPAVPVVDKLSRKPSLEYRGSDMVVGQGGRIHVAMSTNAWKLNLPQNEWGFYFASLEPKAKTFAPVRNINNQPSEGFSLAADEKGNVIVCWLSGSVFAKVSHDSGTTFGPTVEMEGGVEPCECCTTSSVYGSDGQVAVLYRERSNNERDMWLLFWSQDSGQIVRSRISTTLWKIDACPMTYYTVSRTTDGFVAVWPTGNNYDIYFARLNQKGKLLSPGEIKTPGKAGHRTGMIALGAPDGRTLVAWTKDSQLGWQLYHANGQPSGSPGSAKSSGNGVAGVVDQEGRFILFP